MKKVLSYLGVYSLTAASVIPSPITDYAFNLLAFGAVVLLVLAICMAIGLEEIIETAVTEAKPKDKGLSKREKAFRKGKRGLLATYIPTVIVMVTFGHWVVGSCLLIACVIMLDLCDKIAKGLREKADEKKRV